MLGVEMNKVVLVPHDENWVIEYQYTQNELQAILGENVIEICHVGSTAIKGIYAKPILDVAVIVKSMKEFNFTGMKEADYVYCGYRCDTGKHLFVRQTNENIETHHIACYLKDNANYKSTVLFCEYLNKNPEYAKEYSDLKIELALKYSDDRFEYSKEKSEFIEKILSLVIQGHFDYTEWQKDLFDDMSIEELIKKAKCSKQPRERRKQ